MNRKKLISATGVVLLLACVFWVNRKPKEPIYEGKPITYWIHAPQKKKLYTSPGNKEFNFSDVSFPKVDSNAVPYLLAALTQKEGRWQSNYREVFYHTPKFVQGILPKPALPEDEMTRLVVLVVLSDMREFPKSAIPTLVEVLKDDESDWVRSLTIYLLTPHIKDGADVLAAVQGATHDKDDFVRRAAVGALGELDGSVTNRSKPVIWSERTTW